MGVLDLVSHRSDEVADQEEVVKETETVEDVKRAVEEEQFRGEK